MEAARTGWSPTLWCTVALFTPLSISLLLHTYSTEAPNSQQFCDSSSTASPVHPTHSRDHLQPVFGPIAEQIMREIRPENIEKFLRYLTSQPHMAGTKADYEQAEYLRRLWMEQGLDEVVLNSYHVLLSYYNPENPSKVYLMDEMKRVKFTSAIMEPPITEDQMMEGVSPAFLAFSPSGTIIKEELVYVNYGRYEDFQRLKEELGISVKDRLVIARFGQIFRGDKIQNAQRFAAAGVILYTDPADYDLSSEEGRAPYPSSFWLPETGIQRGSIMWHDGDPLTPLYPATEDVYRLPRERADLPIVPCHPVSYRDAMKLMAILTGPEAPKDWAGNLNITYHLGPGLAKDGW